MAKVQEAKEIPTVKVLDTAYIPDKKSFPPRLALIVLGTILGLGFGVAWVLGNETWQETDTNDPRKMFAQEILDTVNADMPWAPPNGSRVQAKAHKIWLRLARRAGSENKSESSDD